jgi:hypothetical protein
MWLWAPEKWKNTTILNMRKLLILHSKCDETESSSTAWQMYSFFWPMKT